VKKTASGFKASEDRLMLLLGGNTHGDFILKLLWAYSSGNLITLKG
jgi:hypothetical protein